MKTKQIILTLLLCAATLGASAQPPKGNRRPRFNPQQYHQMLVGHINKAAELSEQESQDFFKLYDEMKDKQRKLQKQINEQKYKNHKNLSDKEAQQRILKMLDIEEEMSDIKEDYYKKLLKKLPASKVHRAILAEDAFHRQMLRKFEPQQKRPKARPNR